MTAASFWPRGTLARDPWECVVAPGSPSPSTPAALAHTGLRVARIAPGSRLTVPHRSLERLLVPLSGALRVWIIEPEEWLAPERVDVLGRTSVFDGPTDVLYTPCTASLRIEAAPGSTAPVRFALAEAPATTVYPSRHIPAGDIPVEIRGAGRASRRVHDLGMAAVLPADHLLVCEVITPAGNWSSYPAHRHDDLEEIYLFEARTDAGGVAGPSACPLGVFAAGDRAWPVHAGDVALIPYGVHGPAAAAPGTDLYYLNVMAGASTDRRWEIAEDPGQAWVRSRWADEDRDPRLAGSGGAAT